MSINLRLTFAALTIVPMVCLSPGASIRADEDSQSPVVSPPSAAEQRIRAALKKPCQVEFARVPLGQVTEMLAKQYEINIRLDGKSLENVGLGSDTAISITTTDVSLKSALGLMLDDLDLVWMVRHETLMITTPEIAEENLLTRVYAVGDLVDTHESYVGSGPDFESLIELITSTIHPDTWDDVGGPGSIDRYHKGKALALVVSQTERVHDVIQEVLASLRKIEQEAAKKAADKQPAATGESAEPRITVGVYPLIHGEGPSPDELADLVREVIGQDQWSKQAGTAVRGVARSLVVRHNQDVQRRVVETLEKVGALDTSLYPLGPYYSGR